jgi:hypothetical protein
MLGIIDKTSTMLDDLFEADTSPFRGTYRSFCPWGIYHFVSFTSVLLNLLNASCAAALDGNNIRLSWEKFFVHQVCHFQTHGILHKTVKLQFECLGINVRYAAVIAHEVKFVRCDWLCSHQAFRGLAVIWKFQEV